MIHTHCLACEKEIPITGPPDVGEKLACLVCETTFEVVWLFPLELDFVIEEHIISESPSKLGQVQARHGGKQP